MLYVTAFEMKFEAAKIVIIFQPLYDLSFKIVNGEKR